MKRTVKVWMAAVMSGVLLAGGAAMTGQAPWGMEAQAHSGRTDASGGHRDNKNASGLGSYHYHCGGHPAHLHPNGVCPYAGGGESTPDPDPAQTNPDTSPDPGSSTGPDPGPGTGPDPGTSPGADSDTGAGSGLGSFRGRRNFRYFRLASEWGILELYL